MNEGEKTNDSLQEKAYSLYAPHSEYADVSSGHSE
jgi:hypothetical protein